MHINNQNQLAQIGVSFYCRMRNISIVYTKNRRQSCSQWLAIAHHPSLSVNPRRSVDEYYTHLLSKQKHMELRSSETRQSIKRMVLKTSGYRSDTNNIRNTLYIAPAPLHEQQNTEKKLQEMKTHSKLFASRKLNHCKPRLVRLNIMLPLNQLYEEDEINVNLSHCRLKCLYKQNNNEVKQIVLAVSVNFIVNQHYFWEEEQIDPNAVKDWKTLQNYSNLVWICQREQSLKKLIKYSKNYGLRLDAVYLIVPRKGKRLLTVSYVPIESDFGIGFQKGSTPFISQSDRKLVVVNGLLVENTEELSYPSFYQSVPILKNYRSVVYYARININEGGRLGNVVKVLSQSAPPKHFNLMKILRQFEAHGQRNEIESCDCDLSSFNHDDVDLLVRLEQFKKELIKFFSQSLSIKLNEQIAYQDSSNSAQFIIGDMIRRNYKTFQRYHQYCSEYQEHLYHQKLHQSRDGPFKCKRQFSPKKYRNVVYLWEV